MDLYLKVKGDTLSCDNTLSVTAGNVNTYYLNFDIECDIDGLLWFCVFKNTKVTLVQPIIENKCCIPAEVLSTNAPFRIGCYATGSKKDFRRISTNWIVIKSNDGAYCEANIPQIPTPDLWESLVLNSVPYIGDNGNWYIFSVKDNCYIDSQKSAVGLSGYTPQKGVDYYTASDKNEIIQDVLLALPDGDEVKY